MEEPIINIFYLDRNPRSNCSLMVRFMHRTNRNYLDLLDKVWKGTIKVWIHLLISFASYSVPFGHSIGSGYWRKEFKEGMERNGLRNSLGSVAQSFVSLIPVPRVHARGAIIPRNYILCQSGKWYQIPRKQVNYK